MIELKSGDNAAPYAVAGQFKMRLGDGLHMPAIKPSVLQDGSGNPLNELYVCGCGSARTVWASSRSART